MHAAFLDAEALAHRALDVEDLETLFLLLKDAVTTLVIFLVHVLEYEALLLLNPGPRALDYGRRMLR